MSQDSNQAGRWARSWWVALLFILACQAAGILGVLFTPTADSDWFRELVKPAFNPPGWLFGPVWTVLYTLMGIAAYRVWRMGLSTPGVRVALAFFLVQLVVNAAWTPIFFGAHRIGIAAIVIVLLLILILLTTRRFMALDRVAGLLLVPYLIWVSFATALNLAFFWLNRLPS